MTTKERIVGSKINAQIRAFNERELPDDLSGNYVIELKGRKHIILRPKTRARFSKLCYERWKQIKKAVAFIDGKSYTVIS